MTSFSAETRLERLELLHRIGIALSAERDHHRLMETILVEAKTLCHADGGTLYLLDKEDRLHFTMMRTDSLGLQRGGTTGNPIDLPPVPLYDPGTGKPNQHNVASHAALLKQSVNIADAYEATGFDFSGTKRFDEQNDYRSKSFLTIPMVNNRGQVLGVLQLLNAVDKKTKEVVAFAEDDQRIVEALASQAAIAIENQQLLEEQKQLLESFIRMIAAAIDAKSPYTGAHCERVPVLTEMLAQAACEATNGPLARFNLNKEQWYELHIAAWLHDCGKITTPVHVMDKATKLETIHDRMAEVRTRFEVLRRDAELQRLKQVASGIDEATAQATLSDELRALTEELALLERSNIGGEFLDAATQERIQEISERTFILNGQGQPLLSPEEIANLTVSRGTLTAEERTIINGHMVHTIRMLEALPFPEHLERVPEYAGGHHEKMDGKGYPKGLFAGEMSIPARIMAIADVFEALTAADRPYKPGKKLSEAMTIMGKMKQGNHLDPDLFDLFVTSGVYRDYALRFLTENLIDEVDEAALLSIKPETFASTDPEERRRRWQSLLPEYQALDRTDWG